MQKVTILPSMPSLCLVAYRAIPRMARAIQRHSVSKTKRNNNNNSKEQIKTEKKTGFSGMIIKYNMIKQKLSCWFIQSKLQE